MKSADDTGRRSIELAADQAGGTRQFVGDGLNCAFQYVAVRVTMAAIVAQRLHAGDANGEFCQTLAPGASEAVGNDDGKGDASSFLELPTKIECGPVRVQGKQESMPASVHIGDVDAVVGAQEAVMGFGDEDAVPAADNGAALPHGELDHARIESVLFCPGARFGGRLDGGEIDEATFRLGDDLMFHDEDVARLQPEAAPAKGFEELVGERMAGTDFVSDRNGDHAKLWDDLLSLLPTS